MESRGRLRQPMSACGNLVLGWPLASPPQLPPVGPLPAAASILGQGRCLRERNDLALAFPPRLTYTSTGDHREVCPMPRGRTRYARPSGGTPQGHTRLGGLRCTAGALVLSDDP